MTGPSTDSPVTWKPQPVPPRACVLCGASDSGVRWMLIRWREGDPYGSGPRCTDHEGCWARCLANGDEWPVDDGRPPREYQHPGSEDMLDFGEEPT